MVSAPRVLILVCFVVGIEAQQYQPFSPAFGFRPPLNLTAFAQYFGTPSQGRPNPFGPSLNFTSLAQYIQGRPIQFPAFNNIIAQFFGIRPQTTTTTTTPTLAPQLPQQQGGQVAPEEAQVGTDTRDAQLPVAYQRFIQTDQNLPVNTTLLSFYPLISLLGGAGGNGFQG